MVIYPAIDIKDGNASGWSRRFDDVQSRMTLWKSPAVLNRPEPGFSM